MEESKAENMGITCYRWGCQLDKRRKRTLGSYLTCPLWTTRRTSARISWLSSVLSITGWLEILIRRALSTRWPTRITWLQAVWVVAYTRCCTTSYSGCGSGLG